MIKELITWLLIREMDNWFDIFPPLDKIVSGPMRGCTQVEDDIRSMWQPIHLDISNGVEAERSIRTIRTQAQKMMERAYKEDSCTEYWVSGAIMAMYVALEYFAPKTRNPLENKARCAWEIFTYGERAIYDFNFLQADKYADIMVEFLQRAWKYDRSYVCRRFSNDLPELVRDPARLRAIEQAFRNRRKMRFYRNIKDCNPSESRPAHSYVIHPGELTPLPPPPQETTPQRPPFQSPQERTGDRTARDRSGKRKPPTQPSYEEADDYTPPPPSSSGFSSPHHKDHPPSEHESSSSFGEYTPSPPSDLIPRGYDPDYDLSPEYHVEFAKQFEAEGRWKDALEAWSHAIWLAPRQSYRLRRLRVIRRLSPIESEFCDLARKEIESLRKTYYYLENTLMELTQLEISFQQGGCL